MVSTHLRHARLPSRAVRNTGALFLIGSVGYSILEVLWRGTTHWTMTLTGGVCYLAVYTINARHAREPWWKKCFLCSAVITAVEFFVGCVVNLQLGWQVWNYDRMPGNLLGQICPQFSLLWFLLSLPLIPLSNGLRRLLER